MELVNRKSVNDRLKKYTYSGNDGDFIEITEWANGDAIDYLTKVLKYHD